MSKRRPGWRFVMLYGAVLLVFVASGMGLVWRHSQMAQAAAFYQAAVRPVIAFSSLEVVSETVSEAEPPEKSRQVLSLQEEYPDIAAWLSIEGTPVNYPVVRCEDNQYYVNHLPDGSYNAAGSIFMDYRCTDDSDNLILYGHNMGDGTMFGSLKNYEAETYLKEHREFSLFTAEEELRCRIISVRRVRADDETVYAPKQPESTGRTVTLSTCTGIVRTERLIVQAVILEENLKPR